MMTGRVMIPVVALAVASMGMAGAVAPAPAQEPPERSTECRCVDRGGAELENCVCVRTPDMERLSVGPWMAWARPRLGISVDVSDVTAEGARVEGVMEEGPAERAGMREGDVITRVGGHSLLESLGAEREADFDLDASLPAQRLLALARDLEPGEQVEVEYLRAGERRTVSVEAEDLTGWGRDFTYVVTPEWDAEAFEERMRETRERMEELHGAPRAPRVHALRRGGPAAPPAPRAPGGAYRLWMDGGEGAARFRFDGPGGVFSMAFGRAQLDLVELNPELGSYFGVEGGVLVADAPDDSPLGLRPGDVILRIDGREVSEPARAYEILRTYEGDEAIAFTIRREGREMGVSGRLAP